MSETSEVSHDISGSAPVHLLAEPGSLEVLHVGCGHEAREKLPPVFRQIGWREIRLDIDPDVHPDFVASMTDMRVIADQKVDAVYSSHNLEHLYPHEVPLALREMRRVLKPAGVAFIALPDLQEVARHVADGKLEDPLYLSPMGPISPLDSRPKSFSTTNSAIRHPPNSSMPSIVIFQRIAVHHEGGIFCIEDR